MTVITKSRISEKKTEKPLVANEELASVDEHIDVGSTSMTGDSVGELEMWLGLSPSARRRISTTTTVCVFITALLVMSIGIIGGVYLYRQVTQHQRMSRFRGWCGIPYERNALHFANKNSDRLGPNRPFFKEENSGAEWMASNNLFKEEFDLDLDKEEFERIYVPDFGYGRHGQFIHDFKMNKTGIVDLTNGFCFLMPLDRRYVVPARSLFDLIHKMWMGYYSVNTQVIHKTMKIVRPPLDDLSAQGEYIAHYCKDYPTYMLIEMPRNFGVRVRRSILKENGISGDQAKDLSFSIAEFAGRNIQEFDIIDA